MNKTTSALLAARERAPEQLRGLTFDAWLMPVILETLEPMQRDILLWVLAANKGITSADLCVLANTNPNRIGSAASDLRTLGLIQTRHATDELGRYAWHRAAAWAKLAHEATMEQETSA